MPKALSDDKIIKIRNLYLSGKTLNQVADEMNIGSRSVFKYIKKLNIPTRIRKYDIDSDMGTLMVMVIFTTVSLITENRDILNFLVHMIF